MSQRGTWHTVRKKLLNITAALLLLLWQAGGTSAVFALEEPGNDDSTTSVVTDPDNNTDDGTTTDDSTAATDSEAGTDPSNTGSTEENGDTSPTITKEETQVVTPEPDDPPAVSSTPIDPDNNTSCDNQSITVEANGCGNNDDVESDDNNTSSIRAERVMADDDTNADIDNSNDQEAHSGGECHDEQCCKNECHVHKPAKLVIIKQVDHHSNRKFRFKADGRGMHDFSLSGNDGDNKKVFDDLDAVDVSVTEGFDDDWRLRQITCIGTDDWRWEHGGTKLKVKLHENDKVTCIFRNAAVINVPPTIPPPVTPVPPVEVPTPPIETPPVEQPPVLGAEAPAPAPVGGKGAELAPTGAANILMSMFAGSAIIIVLAALTYVTTRKNAPNSSKQ
jgi:hypothetical protein